MNRITFLRDDKTGMLYCNDGLFRRSVFFGNVKGCLKFWRKSGFAKRKARKIGLSEWTIYHVYEGDEVDHFGNIERAKPIAGTIKESRSKSNY